MISAGGNAGADACVPTDGGSAGSSRAPLVNESPQSLPQPFVEFWQRDPDAPRLAVPFSAAAADGGTAETFRVVLCGRHQTAEAIAAQENAELNSLFPTPVNSTAFPFGEGPSFQAPCGKDIAFGGLGAPNRILGSVILSADRADAGETISITGDTLEDGYWGLWTVATVCQSLFPPACTIETMPQSADLVLGVDNALPFVRVDAPADGTVTNWPMIDLTITANDQTLLSDLDRLQCSNGGGFSTCTNGEGAWNLALGDPLPGDGPTTVTARATDNAGNSAIASVTVGLDTTLPTSSVSLSGGELGGGGWYRVPPTITLNGSDDGSGLADFAFRFDSGSERLCGSALSCTVDPSLVASLTTGEHILYFTAVDAAGNRLLDGEDPPAGPMNTRDLRIDDEPPLSALLTVPGGVDAVSPNGANGWFTQRPFVTFSAVDQPGASGLSGSPNAGIFYRVDGALPPIRYDGDTFLLSPGEHELCWSAVDVAGNIEPERCVILRVDDARPALDIVAAPPMPDGEIGWYVTTPTATLAATDAMPGSGIDPVTAPSGIFVSVDGRAFTPDSGPMAVSEGLHDVRAFSVDVSGQRSPIEAAHYQVDLSPPVSAVRLVPPEAARVDWWRRPPRAVLRATDGARNAGVAKILFAQDGAPFGDYTRPFTIPSGVHPVRFRAIDLSGPANAEAEHAISIRVDPNAPRVRATNPVPAIWLPFLGPLETKLGWELTEDLAGAVQIRVIVYDLTGRVVRRIDDGSRTVMPGTKLSGFTEWDGKGETLTELVPLGTYYYRVIATDEAGNVSQSGESRRIQLRIGFG